MSDRYEGGTGQRERGRSRRRRDGLDWRRGGLDRLQVAVHVRRPRLIRLAGLVVPADEIVLLNLERVARQGADQIGNQKDGTVGNRYSGWE